MVPASTLSANEPGKNLILVLTVQLKPMIKAQRGGISISDVASTSVHLEKTRLKKLMKRLLLLLLLLLLLISL